MKSSFDRPAFKSSSERKVLITGITLIALGLSILFLNSWDNVFVKTCVGLFWVSFFLILNAPTALKTFRNLANKNDGNRGSYGFSPEQ